MQAVNDFDTELLKMALELSDAAGDVLRRYFRQPVMRDIKADASPVTAADRDAEQAMRRLIERVYPDHGIIGEEFGNVREQAEYKWVLDPIDGTRAFLGGYPLFTTLISLVKDAKPVLGLIYQPIQQERWLCVAGGKTTLNNHPVSVRGAARLADAVVATTSADYFTPEQAGQFQQLKRACAASVLGGDAYAYAMLASGQLDMVVDAGLKAYDFCALAPVVEGAGGVMADWDGQPISLASDGRVVAAASRALLDEALGLLHKA